MFSPSIGRVQLSAKRAYMVVSRSRASDKGEKGVGGFQRGHPPFISVVEGPWRAPTQKALQNQDYRMLAGRMEETSFFLKRGH